ncbi:RES family NAD+ phosphorylase [Sorangium sp. So ce118]
MDKLPHPPPRRELVKIPAEIRVLPRDASLWRIYFQGGLYPASWDTFRAFGPTGSRFDHHTLPRRVQGREILYAAESGPTCFAEVFQDLRTIDLNDKDPWLVEFRLVRDVRLLDLCGQWPTRAGAYMNINTGSRSRAREWSRTVYAAYPDIEGLWYASSTNAHQPAVALYERAKSAMPPLPIFHRKLSDPMLTNSILDVAMRLGYAVV